MKMSSPSLAPPEHLTVILPGKLRKSPTQSIESGGKDSAPELSWKDRTGYPYDIDSRNGPLDREIPGSISPHCPIGAFRVSGPVRKAEVQEEPLLRLLWHFSHQKLAYTRLPERSWVQGRGSVSAAEDRLDRGSLAKEKIRQKHTVMNTKSAIDQGEEVALGTLKEIVHVEPKTLGPAASVQEVCDELRSEGMTSSPVTDKDGQLLGTVSASDLNRKVGGFGHDPKIELAQTELNEETVYCFEDQTMAEAEKLMSEGNLRQLPVVTREKRMVGIVTLEDIAREQRATGS